MRRKNGSTLVYIIAFFVVFLAFAAFAVDATIVYTERAKLQNATEAAALAGASGFTANLGKTITSDLSSLVKSRANAAFNVFRGDDLESAKVTIDINTADKQVRVTASSISEPYFLALLGVSGTKINAVALAVSESLSVASSYPTINWISESAAYLSDIISSSASSNYNDTAILLPIGNYPSSSVEPTSKDIRFNYLTKGDATPLSLGPGGFITMKLPVPIINKPGPDLFIKEIGDALEGYFVFAGMDADPKASTDGSVSTGPYVSYAKPGAGIKWQNISCKGTPEIVDTKKNIGAYQISTPTLGVQSKFYGSGYFDIGATCSDGSTGVPMAKYIRIIDDNDESAFVKNSNGSTPDLYYKAIMSGESSTVTSGADIDYVDVLNHVRLVSPSLWVP